MEVVLEAGGSFLLQPEQKGYHAAHVREAAEGTLYRFRLDGDKTLYPDPASRFQPDGPHGPSQVIDPARFAWTDRQWAGVKMPGQVIYELHLGTFTREGTWEAAMRELPELAQLGVTVLEIMPIADFAGRFGWGYDGVNLFAPTRLYGTPDDVRRFIDRAHQLGVGVILDVVYNHLGPDGNYLGAFAADYFTDRYKTDWGEAINYDGPDSGPVREYFTANAGYWIDEYHFDGLRLDATQNIYDSSAESILSAISQRVRASASGRSTLVVTENEPQDVKMVRPLDQDGHGFDGIWNDDFHHCAFVALTGRREAYLTDYFGTPQEFVSMAKRGFLYQGQRYAWQKKRRGTRTAGVPLSAFVVFLENHDQVANSGFGLRPSRLSSPGRHRALAALLLLGPGTPMLFQGQEFAASSPFLFFADHKPELAVLVHKGRKEFLAQFPSLAQPALQAMIADPAAPATFEACKLNFGERQAHAPVYALHRDLLQLRRKEPLFRVTGPDGIDGALLSPLAFVLRFFGKDGDDRLLLVNLGSDLLLTPAPEPLLAPGEGRSWRVLWTSEDPRYGGDGARAIDDDKGWHIPGEAAVAMTV
jgi:maltooligosyltrehalose trehalohydrolase